MTQNLTNVIGSIVEILMDYLTGITFAGVVVEDAKRILAVWLTSIFRSPNSDSFGCQN